MDSCRDIFVAFGTVKGDGLFTGVFDLASESSNMSSDAPVDLLQSIEAAQPVLEGGSSSCFVLGATNVLQSIDASGDILLYAVSSSLSSGLNISSRASVILFRLSCLPEDSLLYRSGALLQDLRFLELRGDVNMKSTSGVSDVGFISSAFLSADTCNLISMVCERSQDLRFSRNDGVRDLGLLRISTTPLLEVAAAFSSFTEDNTLFFLKEAGDGGMFLLLLLLESAVSNDD